jgi:hypothetical protein
MTSSFPSTDPEAALRSLARALAPYLAEELGIQAPTAERERPSAAEYDEATCRRFVSPSHMGDQVLLRARKFFAELAGDGQISSPEVVALLELKGPTSIPANLTNPLKKRAERLAIGLPWSETANDENRTVWVDRQGNAARLLAAIDAEISRRGLVVQAPSKFVWEEGDVDILSPEEAAEALGFDPTKSRTGGGSSR